MHLMEIYESHKNQNFLKEIDNIDFELMNTLYTNLVKGKDNDGNSGNGALETIDKKMVVSSEKLEEEGYFQVGLEQIKQGKVTCVILAGGSGSRLGFDHPKGMYDIGLKSGKSIFQILTERFFKVQMLAHETDLLTKDC